MELRHEEGQSEQCLVRRSNQADDATEAVPVPRGGQLPALEDRVRPHANPRDVADRAAVQHGGAYDRVELVEPSRRALPLGRTDLP